MNKINSSMTKVYLFLKGLTVWGPECVKEKFLTWYNSQSDLTQIIVLIVAFVISSVLLIGAIISTKHMYQFAFRAVGKILKERIHM